MILRALLVLSMLLSLSACGGGGSLSGLFGGNPDLVAVVPEGGFPEDHDTRQPVTQITDLDIAQAPGGVIINATGLPPRQGFWSGELVPENDEKPENGVLTYVFRIAGPWEATREGTAHSRRVIVAHFVSDVKLQGVTQIRVLGDQNSRSARR